MTGINDIDLKKKLYFEVLRIRLVEEFIAKEYPNGKMRCPVHLSIGQESIAVGVCNNLSKNDYIMSNHRAHAHYLAKGGSLKKMLAEIMGKQTGCCKGRGGSMHLIDLEAGFLGSTPIVGGTIPIAVGAALAIDLKRQDSIVVVFFGEGATETGVFSESINFASLKKLPIIFICENNFYSVYSPLNVRQSDKRDRIKIAQAHGLYTDKENGNDVEKVHRSTKKAITKIKEDKMPCYLEFDTYRHKEHCGPFVDDHLNYRPLSEIDYWIKNCPVKLLEDKLLSQNILTKDKILKMRKDILFEIDEAFQASLNSENAYFELKKEETIFCEI